MEYYQTSSGNLECTALTVAKRFSEKLTPLHQASLIIGGILPEGETEYS
jgi:hypothetical protein